jgi:hypothetical protein
MSLSAIMKRHIVIIIFSQREAEEETDSRKQSDHRTEKAEGTG